MKFGEDEEEGWTSDLDCVVHQDRLNQILHYLNGIEL